ncbi:MAG: hypothetical protein MK078_02740 [Crocinitomicaceae bacterium]|nr:hypothetical protein [Crocinitomicaceae bacterium]
MLALKIREEINDNTGLANSYSNLGSYYYKVDDSGIGVLSKKLPSPFSRWRAFKNCLGLQ